MSRRLALVTIAILGQPPSRVHRKERTLASILFPPLIGVISLFAVLTLSSCASGSSPVSDLSLHTPRPFGYVIGDRIQHRISMTVARPYVLEKNFLPKPGPLNDWLELTRVDWRATRSLTQRHYELFLTYQIFKGVKAPTTLSIPPVTMRVHDDGNSVEVSTPGWPFSFAPLVPGSAQNGPVGIRPAQASTRASLQPHPWLLAAMIAGVGIIALYCAWCYDALPFLQRHPGPFTRACRALKKLRDGCSNVQSYRAALRIVHQAFNETAGETVFVDQLDQFYQRHPLMADLRYETEAFFAVSRQVFFGQTEEKPWRNVPLQHLENLCREYRKKENSLR